MISAAYAAGLFDGEGGVAISGTKRQGVGRTNHTIDHVRWTKRIYLGNTHRGVLDALAETFGGTIVLWRVGPDRAHHRPFYMWNIYGEEARAFLFAIRPYLLIKREQVDLWLEFMGTMQPRSSPGFKPHLPAGIAERRLELYAALLALNGRPALQKGVERLR